jgi:hypothetical protein
MEALARPLPAGLAENRCLERYADGCKLLQVMKALKLGLHWQPQRQPLAMGALGDHSERSCSLMQAISQLKNCFHSCCCRARRLGSRIWGWASGFAPAYA